MNPLTRHEVISRFLTLYERASYLEIGVNEGETFNVLQAAHKVAVDPQLLFDTNQYANLVKSSFMP